MPAGAEAGGAGRLVSRLLTPQELVAVGGGAYRQAPYAQHFQTPSGPTYKQNYEQTVGEVAEPSVIQD